MTNKNTVYITEKVNKRNPEGQIIETNSLFREEREVIKPRKNEILVRHEYIGLNFFDVDIVRGIIKKKEGFVPGIEATGIIEAVGSDVRQDFSRGERITYCTNSNCGAYSQYNNVHEDLIIRIPDYVESYDAAAFTLRGIFTHALLKRVFSVNSRSVVLLFNPTGAIGHILSQWCSSVGVKVIGVISENLNLKTTELQSYFATKKQFAENYGCDLVVNYDDVNFVEKIMEFTDGKGVQVVYDSIGGNNLSRAVDVMQYCGLFVSLGQNSAIPLKVSMQKMSEKSVFVTRPSIFDYKGTSNELRMTALEIYELVRRGAIRPRLNKIYKFDEIFVAHQDLINRRSSFLNIVEV